MTEAADPRDDLATRNGSPVIPLPATRMTGLWITLACSVIGVGLFSVLEAKRSAPRSPEAGQMVQEAAITSPPPLSLPYWAPSAPAAPQASIEATTQAAEPQLPVASVIAERSLASAPPPPAPPTVPRSYVSSPDFAAPPPVANYDNRIDVISAQQKRDASSEDDQAVLIMDKGPGVGRTPNARPTADGPTSSEPPPEEQVVKATVIRNRSNVVPQGTIVAAVLETPINSGRAGMARAVVAADVRGFDGTRILIPRGSRLIGDAQGNTQAGQKRVLVNWTRLIRPDGVAIRIGSPAADALGGTGINGDVNNHVLARFSNAVLQTAFSIGVNRASRGVRDSVYVGLPSQVNNTVTQIPVFNVPAGPTITVSEGVKISIFVARDLDFGGTGARHP